METEQNMSEHKKTEQSEKALHLPEMVKSDKKSKKVNRNKPKKVNKQSGFIKNSLFVSMVNPLIYKALEEIVIPKTKGEKFIRNNYADKPVNLYGGIVTSSTLIVSNLGLFTISNSKTSKASITAVSSAALAGLVDDLDNGKSEGNKSIKGFKGHLKALKGKVTTGIVKVFTIISASFISSYMITDKNKSKIAYLYDLVLNASMISSIANLHNLLDLRPGRCLKFSAFLNALLLFSNKNSQNIALNNLTVIASALPSDLCEKTMLGDTGSNALGSSSGVGFAKIQSRSLKSAIFACVLALNVLSEKVSFSKIITSHPVLKRIDDFARISKG